MINIKIAAMHIMELEDGITEYRDGMGMYDMYISRFTEQAEVETDRDTLDLLKIQIKTSIECKKVLARSIEINEMVIKFYEDKFGMNRFEIIEFFMNNMDK